MFSNMCVSGFYSNYSSSQNTNGTEYSCWFQCNCMFDLNLIRKMFCCCSKIVSAFFLFLLRNDSNTAGLYSSSLNQIFYYVQQMEMKCFFFYVSTRYLEQLIRPASYQPLRCSALPSSINSVFLIIVCISVTHSEKESTHTSDVCVTFD